MQTSATDNTVDFIDSWRSLDESKRKQVVDDTEILPLGWVSLCNKNFFIFVLKRVIKFLICDESCGRVRLGL